MSNEDIYLAKLRREEELSQIWLEEWTRIPERQKDQSE